MGDSPEIIGYLEGFDDGRADGLKMAIHELKKKRKEIFREKTDPYREGKLFSLEEVIDTLSDMLKRYTE